MTDTPTDNTSADLLQQIASLSLAGGATRPAGLLDVLNTAVLANGNFLEPTDKNPATTVNATEDPLFHNASKNSGRWYSVKNGWGIRKEGDRIHKFEYDVEPALGRVERVFGAKLVAAVDALKAIDVPLHPVDDPIGDIIATAKAKKTEVLKAVIDQDLKDEDALTAVARKNLANLIVIAYHDVVEAQANDLVSYLYLTELAELTLSNDVKVATRYYGLDFGSVALGLVTDLVATGSRSSVFKKAIKARTADRTTSKIVDLNEQYLDKFYKKLKPKVELEAEMKEAGINGGADDSWVQTLVEQAPTMEAFRNMDYGQVQDMTANASALEKEKIGQLFAGLLGGGEVSIARKTMVQQGIDVMTAYEMEKLAKMDQALTGQNLEDKDERDVWRHAKAIVKKRQDALKPKKDDDKKDDKKDDDNAFVQILTKVFMEALGIAKKEKAKAKKEAEEDAKLTKKERDEKRKRELALKAKAAEEAKKKADADARKLKGLNQFEMAMAIGQTIEEIADKNAAQLKADIAETDRARQSALVDAEKLLEAMKTSEGQDLTNQQAQLTVLLSSMKNENFKRSQMKGMARLQGDLEQMSTRFSPTQMNSLKPYDTYQKLVAGTSGGKALKSVVLFSDPEEPIRTASRMVLQVPKSVYMASPEIPFQTTTHRTTSEREMNTFIKSTESSGLSTASKRKKSKSRSTKKAMNFAIVVAEQRNTSASSSMNESSNVQSEQSQASGEQQELASEAMVSEMTFMPMKSFFLEERGLKLTDYAYNQFQEVNDTRSAKKFLKTFGSHIPFGTQTMGGVFIRTMKITSTKRKKVSELYTAAGKKLAETSRQASTSSEEKGIHVSVFGVGGGANTAGGSSNASGSGTAQNESNASGQGEQSGENQDSFESNVICFGPKAATADGLYQQLMKNNATWTIIDRGETSSYLPIWDLIRYNYGKANFETERTLLKDTWEAMALKNVRPDDVELLSDVMDDAPKANLLEMIGKLVKCIVPRETFDYNSDLAKEFQDLISEEAKAKTLLRFISDGSPQKFKMVKTLNYFEARDICIELDESKVFDDEDFVAEFFDNGNPFKQATSYIESIGRYNKNQLIQACVSGMRLDSNQIYPDFTLFDALFKFYEGQEPDGPLNDQLNVMDTATGKYCLHYLALSDDWSKFNKTLETYGKEEGLKLMDNEGNTPLDYLKTNPRLKTFVQGLTLEASDFAVEEEKNLYESVYAILSDTLAQVTAEKERRQDAYNKSKTTPNSWGLQCAKNHEEEVLQVIDHVNGSIFVDNKVENAIQRLEEGPIKYYNDRIAYWSTHLNGDDRSKKEKSVECHHVCGNIYADTKGKLEALLN